MDKEQIINLLIGSHLIKGWCGLKADSYGTIEIESYDKNYKRTSATMFFDKDDGILFMNTGYSIGVSINSQFFVYTDKITICDLRTGKKFEVCFSEVSCNE